MHYPRLLALIDAELDRLHKARLLLASSLGSPETGAKKRTSSGGRPAKTEIATPQPIAPLSKKATSPQETVLQAGAIPRSPARQVRRSRPAPRTPLAPAFLSPLGGVVPSDPVFVSAQQVQERNSTRQATQAAEPGNPSVTDDRTAELLRQRWLQGSAS